MAMRFKACFITLDTRMGSAPRQRSRSLACDSLISPNVLIFAVDVIITGFPQAFFDSKKC